MGAHSFCWFCHVAAHLLFCLFKTAFTVEILLIFQSLCRPCKLTTDRQSRAIHAMGMLILMGNIFSNWLVNSHVNNISTILEDTKVRNDSAAIQSLKKHHIDLDWNAIHIIFLEFALFSTICYAPQFFGTMQECCFTDKHNFFFSKNSGLGQSFL